MKSSARKLRPVRASGGKLKLLVDALEPRVLLSASLAAKLPKKKTPVAAADSPPAVQLADTPAGAAPAVVGRYIYYAGTSLYGDAMATDKSALLPGQTGGFSNVTSYLQGIDEIAIDVSNAAASYSASDFVFKAGTAGDPSTWSAAPAPASVTVVAGAGAGGSTRIYVKWTDRSILNEWLQVNFTAANDVFYFGNLVGATSSLQVTANDELAVRANPMTMLSPAAPTNAQDFNHDGRVDAYDQLVARASSGHSLLALAAPAPQVVYDWHQQTINGVLNIWAPDPGDFGTTWNVTDPNALYGSDGVPQIEGVHQGPIGDCYFLAADGSLAFSNPSRITSAISTDSTGGWAVTFQWWNSLLGAYVPVIVHTAKDLSSSVQTVANGEVWSLVLEKAYAAMRTFNGTTSQDTMSSLDLGFGSSALTSLFDVNSTVPVYASNIYTVVQNALAAHKPVLFSTNGAAPTMVASHVYVLVGVFTDSSGVQWIKTYNPWGFYDTRTVMDLVPNGVGNVVIGTY